MNRLCQIRDIQKAVHLYEESFIQMYGICLNEGMVLCSLHRHDSEKNGRDGLSSGELSKLLGLTASNTSKVIASLEKKGCISRAIGEGDKRQMFFRLTPSGEKILEKVEKDELELPGRLRTLME